MYEHFVVTIPNTTISQTTKLIFVSLILSFLIIFPLGMKSAPTICAFILMTVVIFIFINNMADNKSDALPSTTIPTPPHTGLDGIDVDNLVAGIPSGVLQNMSQ
jgi:hypothetical protein